MLSDVFIFGFSRSRVGGFGESFTTFHGARPNLTQRHNLFWMSANVIAFGGCLMCFTPIPRVHGPDALKAAAQEAKGSENAHIARRVSLQRTRNSLCR
jgi:hypothetical protein